MSADLAVVPRVALTRNEAAAALGMSLNSFERHVQPELRLSAAVARGEAAVNPTRGIEKPGVRCKPKRTASPTEAAKLLKALPADDRAPWATAFYAGLRRGELVTFRWEDVGLATGVIAVCRRWDAVGGEIAPKSRQGTRAVPVPGVLRDFLVEHRMRHGDDYANIGITLDFYGHLMPGSEAQAAELFTPT